MPNILITGANGFVGQHLRQHPFFKEQSKYLLTRSPLINLGTNSHNIVSDLNQNTDAYAKIISNNCIDTVIHLAASVHGSQSSQDIDAQLMQTNVQATVNLAQAAIEQGSHQFIFMSSIGIHGSGNHSSRITETTPMNPSNAYTKSKALAEKELQKIFSGITNTKLHIIRPPMVYGPNSLGSFRLLIKALKLTLPLPFKNIKNEKSFISINNLTDFIAHLIQADLSTHETFVVADKETISTTELIELLKQALNSHSYNYNFPPLLLKKTLSALKKESLYDSLYSNLAIDTQKANTLLNWEAPHRFQDEIKQHVR